MAEQTQVEDKDDAGRGWGTAESWVVGVGVGLVVVALMGAAYTIGYNRGQDGDRPAAQQAAEEPVGEPPAAATGPGKELFTQTCGSCHTLADAGTAGSIGPSLDALGPDAAMVETAIHAGGAGTGMMPANLYTGKQAKQVAAYVAAVAGEG